MIGAILQITPMLSLIDEFAYYQYHTANTKYDNGFSMVAELCYNWTNSKWVPPFA